jgi:predicted acetyltransferase
VGERTVEIELGTVQDKTVFRNLMQLYLHDFSEHSGRDPDPHGLFEYGYLDYYWTPDGRADGFMPFLVKVDGQLAGFVLKNRYSNLGLDDTEHSIAEFFVMRKWRRTGVGRRAAFEVFDRFRGRWEVAQRRSNKDAQAFWRSVIEDYTSGDYEETNSSPPAWDGFAQCFTSVER